MTDQRVERDGAAKYRVCVQGAIGRRWADWFENMTLTVHSDKSDPQTTLTGRVADQAALLGLLGKLITLNFPLLLVEHIPDEVPTFSDSCRKEA